MVLLHLALLVAAAVGGPAGSAAPTASPPADAAALVLAVLPGEGEAVTVERGGTLAYDLAVTDGDGQPVADVTVTVTLNNNGLDYPDQTVALAADGTGTFVWDLPGSVEAGDLRVGFAARKDGYDAGYAYRSATVVAARPALQIQPVSVEPAVAVPGRPITLEFAVTDPGGAPVSPVDWVVDVLLDGEYASGERVTGVTDGAYTFDVPDSAPLGGTYTFVVVAEAEGFAASEAAAVEVTVAVGVAEVQLVHASAALDALGIGPIEVYVDQDASSTTPDAVVDYRGGTPFLHLPAGQRYEVRFRPVTAPPAPLPRELTFTLPRASDPALPPGRFVATLVGIPGTLASGFAPNPDGRPRDLTLVPAAAAPPAGRGGGLPVVVVHAVTDASGLDVIVRETGVRLAQDVAYGEASAPAYLAPGTYTLDVRSAATGERLDSRTLTVDGAEPSVAFVIAGFKNPSANQNGPALAVASVASDGQADTGTSASAPVATEADGQGDLVVGVRPNPSAGPVTVSVGLDATGPARLAVYDVLGRAAAVLWDGERVAGVHTVSLAPGRLAPGRYVVRLESAGRTTTTPLTVLR